MTIARVAPLILYGLLLQVTAACTHPIHSSPLYLARESPFVAVTVHDCYDGDTCTVTLPGLHPFFGDHIPIRVAGVNTPEMRGECEEEIQLAIRARAFLRCRLAGAIRVDLVNPARDKYFRIRARLIVDGEDVGAALIREGLGLPYYGGTRQSWCPPKTRTVPNAF